jgi:hypothetical protein
MRHACGRLSYHSSLFGGSLQKIEEGFGDRAAATISNANPTRSPWFMGCMIVEQCFATQR